jgi:diguanylate cyclase
MEKFVVMQEAAFRDGFPLALVMIDLDDFKKINDTYGHLVGNIILTELAEILTNFFRGSDLIARYGGEEFVVVLNGTPPDIAPRIAEQLRRKIEAHQFPISLQRDTFKQVTISIGLSTTADSNLQPELVRGSRGGGDSDVFVRNLKELADLMIDNADQALYAAKREGKNQLMLSLHFPVDGAPQPETA